MMELLLNLVIITQHLVIKKAFFINEHFCSCCCYYYHTCADIVLISKVWNTDKEHILNRMK